MGCTSSTAAGAGNPGSVGKKGGKIVMEYFNIGHGRGSSLEFLLAHAKADWEKNGIAFEDWPAKKQSGKTGEFGAMPIIYQDGGAYDCSIPTLRKLAAAHGYYPSGEWAKAAVVDMISETYNDILNLWSGAALNQELSNEAKAKVFTDSLEPTGAATKLFKIVEAQLEKNGGRFIMGNMVTMADFCMCALMFG